ncbi:MAG: sigma-70 family RNA polymerase sigma factor [Gemmatimonadota bacterium]|nr:MAG: sigma-70 family RNA polymerase sigma factor [Gemmatimonadota bacterium]
MNDVRLSKPEQWVDRYGDDLFRYALLRLRDSRLAEDIVQETFLAALRARKSFSGRSSEKTWLFGILKHKIVDHIRRASRERSVESPGTPEDTMKDLFDERGKWRVMPSEWAPDPSKILEQKEFQDVIEKCLSDLPSRLSDAFSLREMDGLDSKEVCKVLGVSTTNLWVMLYRARMRLRRCLEMNWFGKKNERNH